MRGWRLVWGVPLLFLAHSAWADDILARCRTLTSTQQRLDCYDTNVDAKAYQSTLDANGQPIYRAYSLVDLKAELKGLEGQKVTVIGTYQEHDGFAVLKEKPTDHFPLLLDVDHLPHDTRRDIKYRCLRQACIVHLYGKIGPSVLGESLIADKLDIN